MAYVAISNRLKQDVRYNINQMYHRELGAVKEPPHPDITPDMIEKKAWGEHYHLKDVIPEHWKHRADGGGIHIYGVNAEGTKVYGNYTYMQKGSMVYPPRMMSSQFTFTIEEVPSLIYWDEYCKQRKEVQERWQNISSSISNYLDSSKSLNDALKHMEELQYYVPQSYLDKVAEKPEKKAKVESEAKAVAAGIDKDALVAGVIAARLAGS